MNMKNRSVTSLSVLLLLSGAAYAAVTPVQKWVLNLDQSTGLVEFDAIGRPSALKIHGKGAAPKGTLSVDSGKASGSLTFDLESLDTGIQMRNEHMKKKYLETERFKQATLSISQLLVPLDLQKGNGTADSIPFQGTLSLHGVQKPVSGVARLERIGESFKVNASFAVKTGDFDIKVPSFAGITMAEDVKIQVQMSAPIVTTQQ